jgi:hypothetical protein
MTFAAAANRHLSKSSAVQWIATQVFVLVVRKSASLNCTDVFSSVTCAQKELRGLEMIF